MTLRTLMQAGPSKVNELFTKLSDTSDGAVKTREKLFSELRTELELHANLEEEHLFPLLRKSAETKNLVTEGLKDNKELRAKLGELDALSKNDDAFLPRLAELQKAFRQHARDEKKELLPAVQRALSAEQVQEVADKIEASLADIEQAKQDEAEDRRAKARQEREQAELEAEAASRKQQEQEAAERRTRETARQVTEVAFKPLEVATETARQVARLATGETRNNGSATQSPPARGPATPFTDMFLWPWVGAMQGTQQASSPLGSAARAPSSQEEIVPLGEEVLDVSKRTVNRGTVRVRRFVVETPVEQQVTLQSEKVIVERRRPVTDKATGEILTELTVEVVETSEVPVVSKRVRLREEIVIRTERSQHVETVKDTVRRDEVEIRQPSTKQPARERTTN